ncbi:hypothetical protein TcBrA4_0043020 [Trypanosoma cruzi]|nr:hypothetical protein TcBrA4_0043020 [Trypanosoma cruzi]
MWRLLRWHGSSLGDVYCFAPVHLLIAAAASVEDLLACIAGTSDGGIGEAKWLRGMGGQTHHPPPADCTCRWRQSDGTTRWRRRRHWRHVSALPMRILPDASRPRATEQRPHRLSFVVEHAIENAPTGALASWLPCGRVLRVFVALSVSESNRQHLLATYDLNDVRTLAQFDAVRAGLCDGASWRMCGVGIMCSTRSAAPAAFLLPAHITGPSHLALTPTRV